jgi:hypothetical protein
MVPPKKGYDRWWEHHNQETIEIVRELQADLGLEIVVNSMIDRL